MPYRPSLRSIWTLLMLAVLCYGLYLWCEVSHVTRKLPNYNEKIEAAKLMDRALKTFEEARNVKGVFADPYGDPRLDAIIGQQFSLITTDFGVFESKLISANPNYAAVVVDLLKKAKVGKGDLVAVSFTGEYPGVNTAVLCACEAVGAIPVTITAIGSSWWGANDPDFTWPDMERLLNEKKLVHSKPVGASPGGARDMAVGLSSAGLDLISAAADRNRLPFISENNVASSIARRYQLYQAASEGKSYKAYVNVGGSVASLGAAENGPLILTGFNARLPIANYPAQGVMHMFNRAEVPLINIFDVRKLSQEYGLGQVQERLPAIGEGSVYITERYDLRIAAIATIIALLAIVVLVKLDSRLFKLSEEGVDPDTLV